jgi:hypothetical protein
MLEALRAHGISGVDLLALHGGHYHTAAYLWLLASASLAQGAPQAEVLSSLALLALHAWLMWRIIDRSGALHTAGRWRYLLMLLVLFPGHLANLQWGWQVAVFLCLAGVSLSIERLTAPRPRPLDHLLALTGAAVACTSFASGLAILPVAMVLLALRSEWSWRQRLAWMMPWVLLTVALAAHYFEQRPASAISAIQPWVWVHYVLNFLAGALFRSVTDLAAPLAALALLQLGACLAFSERARAARPLLAVLLFVGGVAALTATGRAADYGAGQAFVTRYASFSVLFWIAWAGIALTAAVDRPSLRRGLPVALCLVALFAVFGALHFSRKAVQLGQRMDAIAADLRARWPEADVTTLSDLYFEDAEEAHRRLDVLCRWGYPPFSATIRCATPTEADIPP